MLFFDRDGFADDRGKKRVGVFFAWTDFKSLPLFFDSAFRLYSGVVSRFVLRRLGLADISKMGPTAFCREDESWAVRNVRRREDK